MSEPSERFTHEGLVVKIYQDQEAESPEQWGNEDLFLVGFHRQFSVVRPKLNRPDDIRGWSKNYHVFPLHAYIHGGVCLSLGEWRDPFDSGQVGFVLVKRLYCWKSKEKAEQAAKSLVDEWNMYLAGDVWGYVVEDVYGNELDSCWGFYGQKDCIEQAKFAAKSEAEKIREDDAKLQVEMAL